MVKIQLKSDSIPPYGGIFSIFKQFSSSGLRQTLDSYLGKRGETDAKYSYKKADGYFPGIAAVGNLIVGIENRDGNTNVRFHQTNTLERIIGRLKKECGCTVRKFVAVPAKWIKSGRQEVLNV